MEIFHPEIWKSYINYNIQHISSTDMIFFLLLSRIPLFSIQDFIDKFFYSLYVPILPISSFYVKSYLHQLIKDVHLFIQVKHRNLIKSGLKRHDSFINPHPLSMQDEESGLIEDGNNLHLKEERGKTGLEIHTETGIEWYVLQQMI